MKLRSRQLIQAPHQRSGGGRTPDLASPNRGSSSVLASSWSRFLLPSMTTSSNPKMRPSLAASARLFVPPPEISSFNFNPDCVLACCLFRCHESTFHFLHCSYGPQTIRYAIMSPGSIPIILNVYIYIRHAFARNVFEHPASHLSLLFSVYIYGMGTVEARSKTPLLLNFLPMQFMTNGLFIQDILLRRIVFDTKHG